MQTSHWTSFHVYRIQMHVPWMNKTEETYAWTIMKLYYLLNHIVDEKEKIKVVVLFKAY